MSEDLALRMQKLSNPKDHNEEDFINNFDQSKRLRLDFFENKGANQVKARDKTKEKNMNWTQNQQQNQEN